MRRIREQEIEGVLKADGPMRYAHFISQVADWEYVWGLRGPDGWVTIADATEEPMFPVWPHEPYAKLLATGPWADATPTSIEVHEWTEKVLPRFIEDGTRVAVFPTPAGKGVIVDASRLKADIEAELAGLE